MMAGIYIPGMEMPVGHNESSFGIDADGHPLLAVYTEKNTEPEIYYIIPVPDHGRLIDADALVLKKYALSVIRSGSYGTWRDDVPLTDTDAAPTIIPADKDGDA